MKYCLVLFLVSLSVNAFSQKALSEKRRTTLHTQNVTSGKSLSTTIAIDYVLRKDYDSKITFSVSVGSFIIHANDGFNYKGTVYRGEVPGLMNEIQQMKGTFPMIRFNIYYNNYFEGTMEYAVSAQNSTSAFDSDMFSFETTPDKANSSNWRLEAAELKNFTFTLGSSDYGTLEELVKKYLNKKQSDEEYAEKIRLANDALSKARTPEDYKEARALFEEASKIKPGEKLPAERMARIDQAISTIEKNEAQAKGKSVAAGKNSKQQTADDPWETSSTQKGQSTKTGGQTQSKETAETIKRSIQKQTDDFWEEKKQSDERIEKVANASLQNAKDRMAVQDARDELSSTSTLRQTYATVDELTADFNSRWQQINSQTTTLSEATKQEYNSRADLYFNKEEDAGWNAGAKLVGEIVNDIKAADDKKYYREKLEKERAQKLKEIEVKEKQMLSKLRADLLVKFKDSKWPVSSSNINSNALYYYAYSYDSSGNQPHLFISEPFVIQRYGDGTWPFKSLVVKEIAQQCPSKNIVVNGWYYSEQEALAMKNTMQNLFVKARGETSMINYKRKKVVETNESATEDFWGKEKKEVEAAPGDSQKDKKNAGFW